MKIAIFGGTFDPVHHAHLITVEYVRLDQRLDRILFVPSLISPHKQNEPVSDAADRLAMLREAVKGNQAFEVSDMEIKRGGVSYTVDTVRAIAEDNPKDQLFLLIGSDNLAEFHTWRDPAEILRMARLIALRRPGYAEDHSGNPLLKDVIMCDVPGLDISSTNIRHRVAEGMSISLMVPEGVEKYISEHGLYKKKSEVV